MKNKEVMLSGIFTGVSGLFARIAMLGSGEGINFIFSLILNPFLWVSSILGMFGFFYLQAALHKGDISLVEPAISSIAIITPVILAVILLNEFVPVLRWIGVGLLLIGVIGINKGEEKSMIGNLYKELKKL